MKKIILSLALLTTLGMGIANAQWSCFGGKVGMGYATYVDDLVTDYGVMAMNIGGFAEYSFEESNSYMLENISLQSGLNFIRRGYHFKEVYQKETQMSLDYGYARAWYAQIPILVRYRYELPIPQAGHYVVFSCGPAFSMGLFGRYRERKISPRMPQESMNFDNYVTSPRKMRGVFQHIRRPDVNFLMSIGYQYKEWQFDLNMDYGFLATSLSEDRLRNLESDYVGSHNITDSEGHRVDIGRVVVPDGNNLAFFLSATYRIPFVNR